MKHHIDKVMYMYTFFLYEKKSELGVYNWGTVNWMQSTVPLLFNRLPYACCTSTLPRKTKLK